MHESWARAADRLAKEDAAAGRASTAWFEPLWAGGARGDHALPWDRGAPNPLLVEWVEREDVGGEGRSAVVVGAGLGREAGLLASRGFATTAFDVSPTAVALAAGREPAVTFQVADLFDLPPSWRRAFDLVVEIYTVQALPVGERTRAVEAVTSLVAGGGTLLVIQAVRAEGEDADGPPWPLTEAEMGSFAASGLELVHLERVEAEAAVGRRWRARLRRPDRPAAGTP